MKNTVADSQCGAHRNSETPRIAFRIDDAAVACGLSRSTIYNLISAGTLPSFKAAGRRLILAEDLKSFLTASREAA